MTPGSSRCQREAFTKWKRRDDKKEDIEERR